MSVDGFPVPYVKLRQAVYDCIIHALSIDSPLRQQAEQQLKTLEMTGDYAIYLAEIALMKSGAIEVRQMASVLLKQNVETKWHIYSGNTGEVIYFKQKLRRLLIQGLNEPELMINTIFCHCIAFIASFDWPDQWPALFQKLSEKVESQNERQVIATIKVLNEIACVLSANQLELAAPLALELLIVIIEDDKKYSLPARREAIDTLTLSVKILTSYSNCNFKAAVLQKLPDWGKMISSYLQYNDENVLEYGLKTSIIKFVTLLINKIPKSFGPQLSSLLPMVWTLVMNNGDQYTKLVLSDKRDDMEFEDAEGKVVGFIPLVLAIIDFIRTVVDQLEINTVLCSVLPDITYYIIIFIQITKRIENQWIQDPIQYLERDGLAAYDTSVRRAALDVYSLICHEYDGELVMPALCASLHRHYNESEARKNDGSGYWITINESCLQTLVIAKPIILTFYQTGTLQFNLFSYIEYWQSGLEHMENSLLKGCITWFAANYSRVLTAEQYTMFLQSTIHFLQNGKLLDKICALQSIVVFSDSSSISPHLGTFMLTLNTIAEYLFSLTSSASNPKCLCRLVLRTMNAIFSVNNGFSSSMSQRAILLLTYLFVKLNSDIIAMHEMKCLLLQFCAFNLDTIQDKFMPTICNTLSVPPEKAQTDTQAVALEMMQAVIYYCKSPPKEIMITCGFSSVVKCVITSDDEIVLKLGGECLRCFLLLGAQEVCNYTDADGKTGLEYILLAISTLLDPVTAQESCKRIGRLIITLLSKVGSVLGARTHILLRGILSKMQRADKQEVWQSLLDVFAYLFYTEIQAVLGFLTSIPGPTGVSAFEFILNQWIRRHTVKIEQYDRIVNILGLCNLIEYSIMSDEEYMKKVMILDKLLPQALKVVLNTFEYHLACENLDDDDGTSIESSVSEDNKTDCEIDLNEPLYLLDPIMQIDVTQNFKNFIMKLRASPIFPDLFNMLTEEEQSIISQNVPC